MIQLRHAGRRRLAALLAFQYLPAQLIRTERSIFAMISATLVSSELAQFAGRLAQIISRVKTLTAISHTLMEEALERVSLSKALRNGELSIIQSATLTSTTWDAAFAPQTAHRV